MNQFDCNIFLELVMKKLLFLLVLILFANYGCGNKSTNPADLTLKPVTVSSFYTSSLCFNQKFL